MKSKLLISSVLLGIFLSSKVNAELICNDFYDEFKVMENTLGMNLDTVFLGEISSLVSVDEEFTELSFGSNKLLVPKLDDTIMSDVKLKPSLSLIEWENKYGKVIVKYYEASTFTDDEVWGGRRKLFKDVDFYESMIIKGFRYKKKDLNCEEEPVNAKKIINYLIAKAPFSIFGVKAYSLTNYKNSVVLIDSLKGNLSLLIIDNGMVFDMFYEIDSNYLESINKRIKVIKPMEVRLDCCFE